MRDFIGGKKGEKSPIGDFFCIRANFPSHQNAKMPFRSLYRIVAGHALNSHFLAHNIYKAGMF
jgi:hypothetical protein